MTLNRYQRDNLLWYLNLIGYGDPAVEPFNLANTGDWVGEVIRMLEKEAHTDEGVKKTISIDDGDHPNMSREQMIVAIERWIKRVIDGAQPTS
jgi:hypothetical protein